MSEHFDKLEIRDPAAREAALMAALPAQIKAALQVAAFGQTLADIDPASITTRAALARLPVLRKSELLARQQATRAQGPLGDLFGDPFGGFSAIGWKSQGALRPARRVFQSPGPIYEPEGQAADSSSASSGGSR